VRESESESESEYGEEALAIVTAASLALEIADYDVDPPTVGKTNKSFADDDIFEVFTESIDKAAAASLMTLSTMTRQHAKLVIDSSNSVLDSHGP
jgi:hypothetical protein